MVVLQEFRVLGQYESHFCRKEVEEGGEVSVELLDQGLLMGESLC
jgi:hypothetical protein